MEKKKSKILIVDDEPGWRDLISLELSAEDCVVTTASSGSMALEFLRRTQFDLVITDIRMPGKIDGVDLLQTWRRENPAQKAIFMTGYAVEEKIQQALETGDVLLKKPFETNDLLNAVHVLLK